MYEVWIKPNHCCCKRDEFNLDIPGSVFLKIAQVALEPSQTQEPEMRIASAHISPHLMCC